MSKKFEDSMLEQFNIVKAQINHLQNQIKDLQEQNGGLDLKASGLQEQGNRLTIKITGLQEQNNILESKMVGLREQNNKLDTQFTSLNISLTNFQNQMQNQFLEMHKDISRLEEKTDKLDTKIDDARIELKNDISDWSRAYNLHDRKIFQNEGEIKMVKAYIGMVDDSMLTPVFRDKK